MKFLPDLIAKRAELSPHKVALEDVARGREQTYAQLDAAAARVAGMLDEAGIAAGERVAILCRNRAEFFEVRFGCAKAGCVLVPLNWRSPAEELRPALAGREPRLLVLGREDEA